MQLVEADSNLILWRDRLTYQAWGEKITEAQYLRRESVLRDHSKSCRTHHIFVLLNDRGIPVSSCESMEMKSYLPKIGATHLEPGSSMVLMSLYTDPAHRGQGYAGALMSQIVDSYRNSNKAYHSVALFSEIGANLYEKAGFVPICSYEWVLSLDEPGLSSLEVLNHKAKPIFRNELQEVVKNDLDPHKTHFSIWPDSHQIEWYLKRQDLYAEFLGRPVPQQSGVRIDQSVAIWIADYKYDVLRILIYRSESLEHTAKLLKSSAVFAKELRVPEVGLWVTEDNRALGNMFSSPLLKRIHRDDAIAMLAPLKPSLRAQNWGHVMKGIYV